MTYDDHEDCDRQLNEAEEQILKLKAKNKSLRSDVKLWKNRVDEAVIIVANYEDIQAELKKKDELLFAYESVKAPVNPLLAENKRLREALSFDECILRFAKRMQYKLDKNKHKECATMNPNGTGRGWSHCMVAWLLERLLYEADELYEALGKRIANPEAALDEAADVGNFAMMIFDNVLVEKVLKGK